MRFEPGKEFAARLDAEDPLKGYRERFHIPTDKGGREVFYFCGNSLGLQPKKTREFLLQELDDWAKLGVKGHFEARNPWYPYHELLTEKMARLVGARPEEVVVMNSLTVNLHLMLTSFYRPQPGRSKILIEADAFPSDRYAVAAHAHLHGLNPEAVILESTAALPTIDDSVALVLLGNVNYLSGRAYDMAALTRSAHKSGARIGFDLAHGAGNLTLNLHDDGPDFAVWCSYKYLNAGPGGVAGCFVHDRHARDQSLPRLSGWWGHDKKNRFKMAADFQPIAGAEGWQVSNPPIFQLAALRASLEIFDEAGRERLGKKRDLLTAYLEFQLARLPKDAFTMITPADVKARGSQLSLRWKRRPEDLIRALEEEGIVADFREPDVIRLAPVPLYNRFADIHHLAEIMERYAKR